MPDRERSHPADPRLGRRVEHDSESRRYTYPTAGITISAVRHQRHIPVWNQTIGSCTGNAALGCLGTGPLYETVQNQPRFPFTEDGAVEVYSAATRIDNVPGEYPPDDTGSSGLAAAKVLKQAGLIAGYQHTFTLNDALKALQAVPLICGTSWLDGMNTPTSDGLAHVTGRELGGHEYVIDEYDPVRGWLGFQNSWSAGWGVNGRFYLEAEDFADLLRADGDVTVFVPATQPAPTPVLTADETFARSLHGWLGRNPWFYRDVQHDTRAWLDTKHL